MKTLLVLLSALLVNSCITLTSSYSNAVTVQYITPPNDTKEPPVSKELTAVCEDLSIIYLIHYKLPPKPTFDHIPKGDTEAEVNVLIDYIGLLRNELRTIAKDYKCTIQ